MRKEMREFFTPVFFMHSPMQWKYAAKAAHGARGVGENMTGITGGMRLW